MRDVKRSLDEIQEGLDRDAVETSVKVKQMLLEDFTINGAVPITRADIEVMLDGVTNRVETMISNIGNKANVTVREPVKPHLQIYVGGEIVGDGNRIWAWNGSFHMWYHVVLSCQQRQI